MAFRHLFIAILALITAQYGHSVQCISYSPQVKSECDLEKYFSEFPGLKTHLIGDRPIPINEDYGAFLENLTKESIQKGLEGLRDINPIYTDYIIETLGEIEIKIECERKSGVASATPFYENVDVRKFNLSEINAIAIAKYFGEDPRLAIESKFLEHAIFHEVLHLVGRRSEVFWHDYTGVGTFPGYDAGRDTVVSCALNALPVTEYLVASALINSKVPPTVDTQFIYEDAMDFNPDRNTQKDKPNSNPEEPNNKKYIYSRPYTTSFYVRTYGKCMTCALVRPNGSGTREADDEESLISASRYCEERAPNYLNYFEREKILNKHEGWQEIVDRYLNSETLGLFY